MKRKIVLCVPNLGIGGAEKFVVDLALNLDKKRFDVIVAETRGDISSSLKDTLISNDIRIVDLSGRRYVNMLKKQLFFLRAEKPDVIHANTGSILHIMVGCLLCNTPIRLYTVHNEAKLLFGNSIVKKICYKMAFSLFGFIPVAICPTVKETLINTLGISSSKIQVVNNGVDTDRFYMPDINKNSTEVKIVSVGTLYWIKNQKMIINSIVDLKQMGCNIKLTILGDGEDRRKLESIIHKKHANDFISLPGIQKNVIRYLHNADIYVSASRTEGLPLSILEAISCGLPVVATSAGGTKDIVHNGENGYLVPIDDEEAFKEAILKLYSDIDKRRCFSNASRTIAEKWSLKSCVSGYSELYQG